MSNAKILRLHSSVSKPVVALLILALCGCAANPAAGLSPEKQVRQYSGPVSTEANYWWQAAFRMPFDEKGTPRWMADLFLAHQVIAPQIKAHAGKIPLWRFHRRAAPDAAGHQFSLIFYTDKQTAQALFTEIQNSPAVTRLIAQDSLDKVVTQCWGGTCDSALEATSDRSWDAPLQRTWPYFMMGASVHWLALIEEVAAEVPAEPDQTGDPLTRYGLIQDKINALWNAQGQHAYLHHLNALFGYEPLQIRNENRF
ncbi:MAG: hypothetical protein AABY95_01000 [Pseudomonadota bacterium]